MKKPTYPTATVVSFGMRWVSAIYLGLGLLGLLPLSALNPIHGQGNLATTYLLNFVATNTVHNLIHIAIGASGLIWALNARQGQRWCQVVGLLLLMLFVVGIVQAGIEGFPADQRLCGVVPLNSAGHVLHAATGAVILYLGLAKQSRSFDTATSTGGGGGASAL